MYFHGYWNGPETDVFAVSQMPLVDLSDEIARESPASGLLWVIEEHTARGGLAEQPAARIAQQGVHSAFITHAAVAIPMVVMAANHISSKPLGLESRFVTATFQQLCS